MPVLVNNLQEEMEVEEDVVDFLSGAVLKALKASGFSEDAEVSLVFVDDDYIQELNQQYRGMDGPTDVLSFAMLEGEPVVSGGKDIILGDVVISLQAVDRQAKEFGQSFLREAAYLTIHGVLHLLGYDHQEEDKRILMRQKEEEIIKSLHFPGEN
jgi:probable rRNA maturation factor